MIGHYGIIFLSRTVTLCGWKDRSRSAAVGSSVVLVCPELPGQCPRVEGDLCGGAAGLAPNCIG